MSTLAMLGNHLWQSTLFALACAALTLALRNNRASTRHWLWVIASAKFLVPFAALTAVGRELGRWVPPVVTTQAPALVMEMVREPFVRTVAPASAGTLGSSSFSGTGASELTAAAPAILLTVWAAGGIILLAVWVRRWRSLARVVRRATPMSSGRETSILRRLEAARGARPLPLVVSDAAIEPGVFGLFAPVLLWPRRIGEHLDDHQIDAILAHELSHVARRDNLISLLHTLVQSAFWFYPLIWWMGMRIVEERERACDEDVLRLGREPEVYASSILKTCQFSIDPPLPCTSGVTGADLKRRIELIMTRPTGRALGRVNRWLLATAACAVVAGPIAIGLITTPRLRAQSLPAQSSANPTFEVASVKFNNGGENRIALMMQPGGRLTATNVSLKMLIRFSYQVQDFQLVGGPDWMESDRFDILAKAEGEIPPGAPGTVGPAQLMMRSLLADRFRLQSHMEKREMPTYALVLARSDGRLGPGLTRSTVDCKAIMAAARGRGALPAPPPPGERPPCGFRIGPGKMVGGGFPLSQLANSLSGFVQRVVVDQTGLPGDYDLELTYSPDQMTIGELKPPPGVAPPPTDPDGPSLFTALQEQLGLKLESSRGQVDVLVIDRVEKPTPD